MSAAHDPGKKRRKMTVPRFVGASRDGQRLSMLTAYDVLFAKLMDSAGVDSILVGDSLAMVVQGHDTTLPVTLDEMIYHGRIVARAVQHALVIVDMPFMSYQTCPEDAVRNAGRIIKETGADAVKLEGGQHQAETIRAICRAEIPVMAHVGMRPQSVRHLGGMGRIQRDQDALIADALAAEEAGAFGIVLELISRDIAAAITKRLTIPTIGIGAGPDCNGQVLVGADMLGLTDGFHPRFLKRYADLHAIAGSAVAEFIDDVRNGKFPDDEHSHE